MLIWLCTTLELVRNIPIHPGSSEQSNTCLLSVTNLHLAEAKHRRGVNSHINPGITGPMGITSAFPFFNFCSLQSVIGSSPQVCDRTWLRWTCVAEMRAGGQLRTTARPGWVPYPGWEPAAVIQRDGGRLWGTIHPSVWVSVLGQMSWFVRMLPFSQDSWGSLDCVLGLVSKLLGSPGKQTALHPRHLSGHGGSWGETKSRS